MQTNFLLMISAQSNERTVYYQNQEAILYDMKFTSQDKFPYFSSQLTSIINYLLTASEVFTGKSQTETLPYWPIDSEVNAVRPRLAIFPLKLNVWG